jgi:carbamoyl-phosphate synthase small subunit
MNAKLVLEDGSVFYGESFGAEASIAGEVVFNTGMVGYPEAFTDPSYKGQILVLTYPLIGNYGVPGLERDELGLLKAFESEQIQISGLVIADYSKEYSHFTAKQSLAGWLKANKIPAITGVDTRALTKKLREKGVMLGKLVVAEDIEFDDPNKRNLVAEVSIKEKQLYNENGKKRIVLIDCGVKNNIIRSLVKRGFCVIRVPWDYDISKEKYDGLFISNGPGDPKMCGITIRSISAAMDKGIPIFGICLGNQLLALAAGGDTYKLKYGHRSQNQPCTDLHTKRCYITTQNHGFAVDMAKMPAGWEEWFKNENDGTNEGIRHLEKPFMSCQFHPEATPGPVDTGFLFDKFWEMVK